MNLRRSAPFEFSFAGFSSGPGIALSNAMSGLLEFVRMRWDGWANRVEARYIYSGIATRQAKDSFGTGRGKVLVLGRGCCARCQAAASEEKMGKAARLPGTRKCRRRAAGGARKAPHRQQ